MKKQNKTPQKQEKIFDLEEYRRKKRRQKWNTRIGGVVAAVVLLILAWIGIYFYENYDLQGLVGQNEGKGSGILAQSFPISLTGIIPYSITQSGNELVLLTQTSEVLYSGSNAGHNFDHRYTNPVVKQGGGRVLTYDRGGYGYRIDSGMGLHVNNRMDNIILTGTISEKRSYAIVTKESRYAGSVTAFNKGNEQILKWYSASEQIVDVAISPDGRYLAVVCAGFDGGAVNSKIYIIPFKQQSEEVKAVVTFERALPVAVDYKQSGQIHLVTDMGVGVVFKDFSSQRMVYYPNELSKYHFTNNRTYLLSADINSVSCSILVTDGENETTASLEGEALDLSDNGKRLYLLGKNVVTILDQDLTPEGTIRIPNDVYDIEAIGGNIYLLSGNALNVVSADPDENLTPPASSSP